MTIAKKTFTLILLIIFSSLICLGQEENPDKKVDSQSSSKEISLIVTDKNYNAVGNVAKNEIALFIDGKEQTNFTLLKETAPLLYMISIDNSGSMRMGFDDILNGAKSIVNQNNQKDLTALMRFVSADIIQITDKFSSDKEYLHNNLDLFAVEGGQTALIDAIYNSVEIVAKQSGVENEYRRAVIVISDGEDRASSHNEKQLLELLRKEKVQVFFIGLTGQLDKSGGFIHKNPQKRAEEFINTVTQESGGVAIILKKTKELSEVATKINSLMRTQYILKFQMPENIKDDTKIKIKLADTSDRKHLKFYFSKQL